MGSSQSREQFSELVVDETVCNVNILDVFREIMTALECRTFSSGTVFVRWRGVHIGARKRPGSTLKRYDEVGGVYRVLGIQSAGPPPAEHAHWPSIPWRPVLHFRTR